VRPIRRGVSHGVTPGAVGTLVCTPSRPIFILNCCLSRCPSPPPPGGGGLGEEGGGGGGVGWGMGALASVPHPFSVCWNPLANRFRGYLTFTIFLAANTFFPLFPKTKRGGHYGRFPPASKLTHITNYARSGDLVENWSKVRISSGDNTHKISAF
jgi:hypothetical protein